MRWLQNISFSSTSSTSAPSSSPKPTSTSAEEPFSPTKRYSSRSNPRGALRSGVFGARLTRQKKLRHLGENEITRSSKSESVDNMVLSRSPSCSSSVYTQSSRLSTSVPVPLPLPLPNGGDDGLRFPSPKDKESVREKSDDGGSSSNLSAISRDARRAMEQGDTRPLRNTGPQDMNNPDKSRENFRLNVPIRSAPTSPFGSPVLSPHQTGNAIDLLPYYHMIAKGNQVWSAPEMATLDIPGLPPPAFFDFSAFSTDSSPLHSPPNISPRWNTRSNTSGPPSPLTTKMSIESSTVRRDSNATIEVHPLPLPPGAALSSPTCSVPQGIGKAESTRMKSQWQKGKLIGRGTFGSVYVASNRETGALCAMKEVELFPDDPKSAECMKQLEQEIKVLSKLKHPNIVQYYGSEIVDERFYIYLEYVHPGSINKYAREHCGAITESVVRSFTRHIVSGLAYLHSMKTIHRDIKGANLLVDASGVVKLADFGMAKHLTGQVADLSLKGSPYWMAPELLQAVMQKDTSTDLALAVDIWSLGCTIIEMFNGKPPWSEYEGAAAMFKVLRDTPPIPDTLSPEGKDFLRCCFKRNPAERPSASMLLEHRWLRNSHLDVSSSSPSPTVAKLAADMSYSPRTSDVKLEQWPIFSSSQSTKGKLASESSGFAPYTFSSARMSNDLVMRLPT